MAFTRKNPGDDVLAEDVNEIQAALEGDTGYGQPIALTDIEEAGVFALDVRNRDASVGPIARFRNNLNTVLLAVYRNIINVGVQIRSYVALGTAPLHVDSTTVCPNLNADRVDGYDTPFPNAALGDDAVDERVLGEADQLDFMGAFVYRSTRQLIPNSDITPLSWNTVIHNTHGMWDAAAPGRFTAQEDGWYIAGGNVSWAFGDKTKDGYHSLGVRINGTRYVAWGSDGWSPSSLSNNVSVASGPFWLNAGDYVEVMTRQISGESQWTTAATLNISHAHNGWMARYNRWPS